MVLGKWLSPLGSDANKSKALLVSLVVQSMSSKCEKFPPWFPSLHSSAEMVEAKSSSVLIWMDFDASMGGCTAKQINVGSNKNTQRRNKEDMRMEDTLFM